MPALLAFCQWLENTPMGAAMRNSGWMAPAIETVHICGIIMLLTSNAILGLRLLGFGFRREHVSKMAKQLLPWAWFGFALLAATGFILFSSEATKYYVNAVFRLKMVMILLAGMNALVFHWTVYRRVATWDEARVPPLGARLAGCFSIVLWICVVAAGRLIAYYLPVYYY
jgi:hypothetical protein